MASLIQKKLTNTFLYLSFILLNAGCIESDLSECKIDYLLHIKAEDNSGYDISNDPELTDGYIYIYDNKNRFIDKLYVLRNKVANKEPIKLSLCPNKSYKIVAWMSSFLDQSVAFNSEHILGDNHLKFIEDNGEYKTIHSTLYYGQNRIPLYDNTSEIYSDKLIVRRKIALMHISVSGINEDQLAEDYSIEIEGGTYNSFNFEGKPYKLADQMNRYKSSLVKKEKLSVTPKALKVAPLESKDGFTIKLYYKHKLIKSFNRDHIGNNISPQAGERMNILIEMNSNTSDNKQNGRLIIGIKVDNWENVELWKEWI